MKTFGDLIKESLPYITEVLPWDLEEIIQERPELLLIDVREPYEFECLHITNSLSIPRGVLESACEYGYSETVPELVEAKQQEIVVICRSGQRSALAAHVLTMLGYDKVSHLKTGLRGWNDYELMLVDSNDAVVDVDDAEGLLNPSIRPEQMGR